RSMSKGTLGFKSALSESVYRDGRVIITLFDVLTSCNQRFNDESARHRLLMIGGIRLSSSSTWEIATRFDPTRPWMFFVRGGQVGGEAKDGRIDVLGVYPPREIKGSEGDSASVRIRVRASFASGERVDEVIEVTTCPIPSYYD